MKQRNKNRRRGWGVRRPVGVAATASALTSPLGSVLSTAPPPLRPQCACAVPRVIYRRYRALGKVT